MFVSTLLCGAAKGFMKAFETFIKPFEAPQRSVKIKIQLNFFTLSGIGPLRDDMDEESREFQIEKVRP